MDDKKKEVVVPEHDHLFDDHWYPKDKFTVRRTCCYPKCIVTQEKDVRGVPA